MRKTDERKDEPSVLFQYWWRSLLVPWLEFTSDDLVANVLGRQAWGGALPQELVARQMWRTVAAAPAAARVSFLRGAPRGVPGGAAVGMGRPAKRRR